jgi:hypothetical protein
MKTIVHVLCIMLVGSIVFSRSGDQRKLQPVGCFLRQLCLKSAQIDPPQPVMTPELARTTADLDAVPRFVVDVRVRVVDAADGRPVEGAQFKAFENDTFFTSDRDGIVLIPRGREVGVVRRVAVGIERAFYRDDVYRPTVHRLFKDGVEVDTSRLVLPVTGVAERAVQSPEDGPVDIEVRLDFDGKFVEGRAAFTPEFSAALSELRGDAIVPGLVIVDAGASFDQFSVDLTSGTFRVGPVPQRVRDAYLAVAGVAIPFTLSDGVRVPVDRVAMPYALSIEYRNLLGASLWVSEQRLSGGWEDKIEGVTAVRLADTLVRSVSLGRAGAKVEGPVPPMDVSMPEGSFALLPRGFGGGPFHFMFIRAIRKGIDVAALGVPVVTLNAANPTASAIVDGARSFEVYQRVKKALDDKLAADAAAKGGEAVPAQAPTPPAPGDPAP